MFLSKARSLCREALRCSWDALLLMLLGVALLALLAPMDISYRTHQYLDFALQRADYVLSRMTNTRDRWPETFTSCDAELLDKLLVRAQHSSLANDYAYISDETGFCRAANNNDINAYDFQNTLAHPLSPGFYLTSKTTLAGELFLYVVEIRPGHFIMGNTNRQTLTDIMLPSDPERYHARGELSYLSLPFLTFGRAVADPVMEYRYLEKLGPLRAELILPGRQLGQALKRWLSLLAFPWTVLSFALPMWWRRKRSLHGIYLNDIELCYQRGEIYPVYQPIVATETGAVVGYEQLARWDHPSEGPVPPSLFVALLEQHQRLNGLTVHLVRQAIPTLSPDQYLSLNLTLDQLVQEDLDLWLVPILKEKNLRPQQVVIEITEREPLAGEQTVATLKRLQQAGFRLALDDFGTGHNDLGFLGQFRPDLIKIDKSYTQAIGTSSLKATMLEAMVKMGVEARIPLVVEGVETEAQADYLRQRGVAMMQGYFFGYPARVDHPVLSRARPAPRSLRSA
ncbi:EAL domain-containing protein [Marinobacter hydrocarbonoclasticus]|nr:EAL domain-containing protein [Marinobacter nauticus]